MTADAALAQAAGGLEPEQPAADHDARRRAASAAATIARASARVRKT